MLAQVARGLSNAEIGRVLLISEATVKTHLLRIFEKLGVGDRTAAVTTAMARGILPRPRRHRPSDVPTARVTRPPSSPPSDVTGE